MKRKSHFARYGCPEQVVGDNGPQFKSHEFAAFSKAWDFEHVTSSPGHQQANGKAESAVKTAKRLLRKAKKSDSDQYLAILDYRNTPTQGLGSSPTQRLMRLRRARTLLPMASSLLQPRVVDPEKEKTKMMERQSRQANLYNRSARDLPSLEEGTQLG